MPSPTPKLNLFQQVSAKMDRANERFAAIFQGLVNKVFATERFRATKEAVLTLEGVVLFGIGATLMQIGEWFFAVCIFTILGFLLLAKSLTLNYWAKNFVGCIGSALLSTLLITITVLHKPESEPWSNLQKLRPHRQVTLNAAPPIPQSWEPHERTKPGAPESSSSAKPVTHAQSSVRPYDFSGNRRKALLALLKPPLGGANSIRVGCVGSNDRSCLAAGQFLLMLSEAGWTIEGDRVLRMEESIPTDGVSIVSLPEPGPPQPPHLGRWHQLNTSEVTLALALLSLGIKESGSADSTLRENLTGVYFSTEPDALKVDRLQLRALKMSKLRGEITNIEKLPNSDPKKQSWEFAWNQDAENWLRANVNEASALQFRECVGQGEKIKYFQLKSGKKISAIRSAHEKEER